MCMAALGRTALSPITTSVGQGAAAGGVAGALLASRKKRTAPPTAAPVLAPTEALHNSSLFNTRPGG